MTDDTAARGASPRTAAKLKRIAGRLCLDLVNTAVYDGGRAYHEHLHDFEDVVQWGEAAGLLNAADAQALRRHARSSGPAARTALREVRALRAALYALFSGRRSAASLAVINRAIASARLVAAPEGVRVASARTLTGWLTGPVALSAAELASSPDLARVHACEGDRCGWLFLDRSPGRVRRWCAMEPCGNRVKARSHYRRQRSAAGKDGEA